MKRAKKLFEESGLSYSELGQRMGYSGDAARKSAWQFLTETSDPRLSMLERFAKGLNLPITALFE